MSGLLLLQRLAAENLAAAQAETDMMKSRIAKLEAELAASKKINELRTKVYIVKFLTAFCSDISCYDAVAGC